MSDAPIMHVGERGWYRDRGVYLPARCLATDIRQTFGRINQAVAVDHGTFESLKNLVNGTCPTTGGHWVSDAEYKQIRRRRIIGELRSLMTDLEALNV